MDAAPPADSAASPAISWSFSPNPFVGGVQQPDLTQPVLNLDTTGWAPAAYTGRLTVTNTVGASSNVSFTFSVVPGTAAIPPPDATVTAPQPRPMRRCKCARS